MKTIQIVKFPDRKRTSICVYDEEKNIAYPIAYLTKEEHKDLFIEALTSCNYKRDDNKYEKPN